jgi:hypothetical protein
MSDNWHSLPLGDGMMADEPSKELRAVFQTMFMSAGEPADMAIFTRHESEGRLHCEVIAYFSPAASEVAVLFGAEPCQIPTQNELALLAGSDDCWSTLFQKAGR